jgi:hypothetical protein
MNRIIAAASVALCLTACSESTAPGAASDLAVSYGKKTPPPPTGATGTVTNALFTFDTQTAAAASGGGGGIAGATVTTNAYEGVSAASPINPVPIFNHPSNYFVGRFSNTQTVVELSVPNGGNKYSLDFDFYAIGSWDGIGKQAQSGAFLANVFQVGAICSSAPATIIDIFTSTFSNQLTVQQNFPLAYGSGGGAKALTGSVNSNENFYGDPSVNVPVFRSVSDATYHLSYAGNNPCGSGAVTFVFRTYAPGQQSAPDETWGVDNISIKTDN